MRPVWPTRNHRTRRCLTWEPVRQALRTICWKGTCNMTIEHESKPGYLTTEFWITILILILNNLSVLPIPDKYQGITNVATSVAYILSRGIAKIGAPEVTVPVAHTDPSDI